uniref:Uncharacterized protein n=1 Tax=Amorphochlora amoebiformis TaxID=1561963 RepID=A0A7S0DKB0_9EUKA|mmetsp:Transcript_31968/g.51428  ORF Transcript_31968/g.51428 Transcript_31968/m.51428 type:complete len:501 (+) Transcript_31968:1-1503(+)
MLTECRKREAVLSRFAWWPGMSSNRLKGAVRARKMNPCQQDEGNYVRLEAYGRGEALRSWFVTKARADEYPFELERMQKAPSASGRESLIFLCRNKMNESLERIVSDEYDHLDPGLIMQAWEAINPEEVRSFLTTLISLVPSQYLARVLELSESLSSGHSTIHDVMKKIPFIKSTFRGSVYERIQRDTDIAVFEKLLGLYISMVNPIDLMSIHRDLFMGRYLSAFPVDKKQSTWQLHQWLKSSDDYRVQAAGRLPTYFQPYHPEADRVRDKTSVDCKVLIRNIDPNLTVYDIMAAFKHLGELDGVEVMKEQMQPSFRRLNFSNYQNLIKGSKKASIDIRMKWFSKVYGWLYFKNAEAAAKASSESIRFFGLSFPPLNSYIKKVRPNQKGVESVFKTKSQDITSAIQTCPASDVTELWVGNLRNATSVVEAECIIAETLAKKSLGGSLKVSHTFRMDDSVISPVGTGVARITFDSHSDANRAYRILNKSRILPATWSTTKT